MALNTYHVVARRLSGMQVEASARNFTIRLDEPEASGGSDSGMNPVELLLCSIASCQTITTVVYADFYGIPLEHVWVELEGDIDSDGFSGLNPDVRPGLQVIRPRIHIKSAAPAVQVRQLVKLVEQMCPVGDSVGRGVSLLSPELELE